MHERTELSPILVKTSTVETKSGHNWLLKCAFIHFMRNLHFSLTMPSVLMGISQVFLFLFISVEVLISIGSRHVCSAKQESTHSLNSNNLLRYNTRKRTESPNQYPDKLRKRLKGPKDQNREDRANPSDDDKRGT